MTNFALPGLGEPTEPDPAPASSSSSGTFPPPPPSDPAAQAALDNARNDAMDAIWQTASRVYPDKDPREQRIDLIMQVRYSDCTLDEMRRVAAELVIEKEEYEEKVKGGLKVQQAWRSNDANRLWQAQKAAEKKAKDMEEELKRLREQVKMKEEEWKKRKQTHLFLYLVGIAADLNCRQGDARVQGEEGGEGGEDEEGEEGKGGANWRWRWSPSCSSCCWTAPSYFRHRSGEGYKEREVRGEL